MSCIQEMRKFCIKMHRRCWLKRLPLMAGLKNFNHKFNKDRYDLGPRKTIQWQMKLRVTNLEAWCSGQVVRFNSRQTPINQFFSAWHQNIKLSCFHHPPNDNHPGSTLTSSHMEKVYTIISLRRQAAVIFCSTPLHQKQHSRGLGFKATPSRTCYRRITSRNTNRLRN